MIGFLTAAVLNINALVIANELFQQSELRSAVVASAETFAAASPASAGTSARVAYERSMTQLHALAAAGLPMGWGEGPAKAAPLYVLLLGWLITAIAVTLGAPFWFDLLNKFMVLRSTLKPRQKPASPEMEEPRGVALAPDPAESGVARAATAAGDHAIKPASPVTLPPPLVAAGFQPHEWAEHEEEGVL